MLPGEGKLGGLTTRGATYARMQTFSENGSGNGETEQCALKLCRGELPGCDRAAVPGLRKLRSRSERVCVEVTKFFHFIGTFRFHRGLRDAGANDDPVAEGYIDPCG